MFVGKGINPVSAGSAPVTFCPGPHAFGNPGVAGPRDFVQCLPALIEAQNIALRERRLYEGFRSVSARNDERTVLMLEAIYGRG